MKLKKMHWLEWIMVIAIVAVLAANLFLRQEWLRTVLWGLIIALVIENIVFKDCPSCGKKLWSSAMVCKHCGAKLYDEPEAEETEDEE